MLSKPNSGWTIFSIGDFQTEASYLVDIPFEWLRACKNGLKYNIPVSLFIEEEGSTCIVTTYHYTHIIIENDDITLKTIKDVDYVDLSFMLLTDIKEYFEDWAEWYAFEQTEADFTRRKNELRQLINETEKYLYIVANGRNKSYAKF